MREEQISISIWKKTVLSVPERRPDQVTWMDVRVGEILPTPRHGKPVEINAYWYNALCIMQKFSEVLKKNEEQKYGELAQKVKESFAREFWMEENIA